MFQSATLTANPWRHILCRQEAVRAEGGQAARHPTAKTSTTAKAKQHTGTNKEKGPSFWSSVFDHVKGWFGN